MILKNAQHIFHEELDTIYGKEEVDSFFYLLIDSFYETTRIQLATNPELAIADPDALNNALELLKQEKPIQYILGETEFFGLPFKVNKNVLIPRPETEELVAWVLKYSKNKEQLTILDIGTGSGCIAVSLAKNLPKAKVYALDISTEAIKIAKYNAEQNNTSVEFIHANILKWNQTELLPAQLKFDVIVSNPPYIREKEKQLMKPNVLNNEPHLALFVQNENPLLFYEAITEFASKYLAQNGMLFFEINEYLGNDMIKLLKNNNFETIELKQDIFRKDRMIKGKTANE